MEVLIIILDFFLLTSENNGVLVNQNNNITFILYAYIFIIYIMTVFHAQRSNIVLQIKYCLRDAYIFEIMSSELVLIIYSIYY